METFKHLQQLNQWIELISRNYVLILSAGILFFAVKGILALLTYRQFRRDIREIKELIKQHKQ